MRPKLLGSKKICVLLLSNYRVAKSSYVNPLNRYEARTVCYL